MAKIRMRDVLVVLPGITGSVLQRDGVDVWAASGQAFWGATTGLGQSIRGLGIAGGDDPEAEELGDGVRATRLIEIPRGVAGLAKSDGYATLRRFFSEQFELVEGLDSEKPANYFEFAYDWRRDNRAAAHRLKRLVDRRLPQWREFSGCRDAKAILVAHSMGGLVGRYYAEVLEGWRDCRALITLGTPYRGSVNALMSLNSGYKRLCLDFTEVLRSFPSVHQLLPIYEMLEIDGHHRRLAEVDGIPGVDRARAEQALRFHREIEAAVDRNKDEPAYSRGFVTIPVVGISQPTLQSASFAAGRLAAGYELPSRGDSLFQGGDGTVPRVSAVPIELSDDPRLIAVAERHSSLQRNGQVLDWLRESLRQLQGRGLKEIRGPDLVGPLGDRATIGLGLDDVYLPDEPVAIAAILDGRGRDYGPPVGRIEPVSGGAGPLAGVFQDAGDAWVWDVEGLGPGLYRVEVQTTKGGPGAPTPVHDVFEVVRGDDVAS
jgi:pimeloyl-ACP methyl ester carboxylesterase